MGDVGGRAKRGLGTEVGLGFMFREKRARDYFIRLFYLDKHNMASNKSRPKINTNQVSENIYCNSSAYDIIFDSSIVSLELSRVEPHVTTILNQYLPFF